jgi:hypothetical protein
MTDSVALSVDVVGRIDAAFHQNRIPVVGSIELRNDTDRDIENVSIEVTSSPSFLVPHRFTFDRIKAGAVQQLSPVPVELDPKVMLTQSERVRGSIVAVARAGSDEIARCERDCELLSPAEWTGIRSAPELVAAFVRPNDPMAEVVLREGFYDPTYRGRLRRMTAIVIDTEGPIIDDLLVRRIARHHGFGRAGAQVRDIVFQAVEHQFPRSIEGERTIFWPAGSDKTIAVYRVGAGEARDHSEIPDVELAALARRHLLNGATAEEAALLMARDLDIGRLRQGTRERLEGVACRVLISEGNLV